jgi:hypothetical protein
MKKNLLLIHILIYFLTQLFPIHGKSYDILRPNTRKRPKFISFNTNSGKIEVNILYVCN